jgi:hypothetical protein
VEKPLDFYYFFAILVLQLERVPPKPSFLGGLLGFGFSIRDIIVAGNLNLY